MWSYTLSENIVQERIFSSSFLFLLPSSNIGFTTYAPPGIYIQIPMDQTPVGGHTVDQNTRQVPKGEPL